MNELHWKSSFPWPISPLPHTHTPTHLKEALADSEQRPVVLLEDRRGRHQQRRGAREQVRQLPSERRGDAVRVVREPVRGGGDVGERELAGFLENADLSRWEEEEGGGKRRGVWSHAKGGRKASTPGVWGVRA